MSSKIIQNSPPLVCSCVPRVCSLCSPLIGHSALLLASDWPRLAPVSRGRAWHGRREAAAAPGRYQRQREARPEQQWQWSGSLEMIRWWLVTRWSGIMPLSSGDVTSSVPRARHWPGLPSCLCFEPHRPAGWLAWCPLMASQDSLLGHFCYSVSSEPEEPGHHPRMPSASQ